MGMLAIVAPGQGAQVPGFLSSWMTNAATANRLAELAAGTGLDLVHFGTVADAEAIRDTAIAQPLMVASALAVATELLESVQVHRPGLVFAGHSVGELAATALAGTLTWAQTMTLVSERGRAMAAASRLTPTSMTVLLGGQPAEVIAAIERQGLTVANNNGPGQLVAAGTVAQLAALAADPPARVRLRPLQVAGAFHTSHMEPAAAQLRELASKITPSEPTATLLSNADGEVVTSGADALARLVAQVARPVRWDLCLQTMARLGVTGLLELPPAGTLTGIAKRQLPGVELLALNDPDQLTQAQQFISKHQAG